MAAQVPLISSGATDRSRRTDGCLTGFRAATLSVLMRILQTGAKIGPAAKKVEYKIFLMFRTSC